ncbi:Zn-ribbon domain-containing OB-fold protein [Methanonatronarchaeum sp. AMET-Sl]|uniref:Zn-ribbon domain-containing OB-fold protein n=1 Tax=Methanonatronarchaeum sp. AMET-Sl TaxID=3037654 RepID=UPI00244DE6C3|nr:Zn-ribbon domain-containing OB-fold protein [Methanonatronarchaeum sp. AMET-Sl]WGI17978.1 Zn-ribbon domain-containing OB-fold protein [Methanonatronarchaeum sp. AMET-Sl]
MPKSLEDIREICFKYEIPVEKTKVFWEKLEANELVTSKCVDCGKVMFPPQSYCQSCLSSDIEWIDLDGEAVVQSFTHIDVRPKSFRDEKPYTIVVAEFKKYDSVSALAWIENVDREDVEIGLEVELFPKQREKGPPYYVFKPIG